MFESASFAAGMPCLWRYPHVRENTRILRGFRGAAAARFGHAASMFSRFFPFISMSCANERICADTAKAEKIAISFFILQCSSLLGDISPFAAVFARQIFVRIGIAHKAAGLPVPFEPASELVGDVAYDAHVAARHPDFRRANRRAAVRIALKKLSLCPSQT